MMPSYAAVSPSGFGGRELAVQFFHLVRSGAPALQRAVQLTFGLFELRTQGLRLAQPGCVRVKPRILQRGANGCDLPLELLDAPLDVLQLALSTTELTGE